MTASTAPTLAQAAHAYRTFHPPMCRTYVRKVAAVCVELGDGRRLDQVTGGELDAALARRWRRCTPGVQADARCAVRAWLRWCHAQGWRTPMITVPPNRARAIDGDTLAEANWLRGQGLSYAKIAQNLLISTGPLAGQHPSPQTVTRSLTHCTLSPAQAARALQGIECVVLAYSPHLNLPGRNADQHGYYRPHPDTLALLCKLHRLGMPVAVTIPGPGRPQPTPPKQARVPRALRDAGALVLTEDELGQTKPRRGYYQAVAQACQLPPERLLHVGPFLHSDVLDPIAAGMRAALEVPNRQGPDDLPAGVPVLGHPRELPHLVARARAHRGR